MDAQAEQFFDLQAGSLANLKQHWNRIIKTEWGSETIDGFFQKLFASIFFSYQSATGNQYSNGSVNYVSDVIKLSGRVRPLGVATDSVYGKRKFLDSLRNSKGVYTNQDEIKKVLQYLGESCMEYEESTQNEAGTFFTEVIIAFMFLLVSSESLGKEKDDLAINFLRDMMLGLTGGNGVPEEMMRYATANRTKLQLERRIKKVSGETTKLGKKSTGKQSSSTNVSGNIKGKASNYSNNLSIESLSIEGLKDRRWTLMQHHANAQLVSNLMSLVWLVLGVAIPAWTGYQSSEIGPVFGAGMPFLAIAANGMLFNGLTIGSIITYVLAIWVGHFGFYGAEGASFYVAVGIVVFWFTTRFVPRMSKETLETVKRINELLESKQ